MQEKKFKRSITIKYCDVDFGIGAGVLAEDEIVYRIDDNYSKALLTARIIEDLEDFIQSVIDIKFEEIDEKDNSN